MKLTLYYGVRLYDNRIINEDLTKATKTQEFTGINFILNDGINTSQTLNDVDSENSPTYVIVNSENDGSGNNTMWYVMSAVKNRDSQLTLNLRRDFISEKWDILKNSNAIIRRAAHIDNFPNAKYKREFNLSEVKKNEVYLRDRTYGNGWIVFYFDRKESFATVIKMTYGNDSYTLNLNTQAIANNDSVCRILVMPVDGSTDIPNIEQNDFEMKLVERITHVYTVNESLGPLYDVQWVPYVPGEDIDGYISDTKHEVDLIKDSDSSVFRQLYWLTQSTDVLTYNRSHWTSLTNPIIGMTNTEQKTWNEEHKWRLTSPNYSSSFDFSIVNNNSDSDYSIYIYIALKPINPFFYITPLTGGLYGSNFNDGRGLILSGDYSLPVTTDRWTEYKLQNKNYQEIFNRQIESLDLQNKYSNVKDIENAIGSALDFISSGPSGAIKGGITGLLAGGPIGAAIGAGVGKIGSQISSAVDLTENIINTRYEQKIRYDAKDAAIDQFNYQIGNIQALPYSLSKIGAFVPTNKIYPMIEMYECTDAEKTNLENTRKYSGYDINEISTLNNFNSGFVSGVILEFPNTLNINDNQALAINNELTKGVYIKEVS